MQSALTYKFILFMQSALIPLQEIVLFIIVLNRIPAFRMPWFTGYIYFMQSAWIPLQELGVIIVLNKAAGL